MPDQITLMLPREQAGPQTGRKYEVQYEEAALACLKLLEEGTATCIYCEWHDDFVVERDGPRRMYEFHQVKTRPDSKGAWSVFEVLGVKKPRSRSSTKSASAQNRASGKNGDNASSSTPGLTLRKGDSIAHRMLDHYRKFSNACAAFALVSPVDVATDPLFLLVREAKSCEGPDQLAPESRALFEALLNRYQERDGSTTSDELWGLVRRLTFVRARANESDPQVAIGLMGQLIHELSEVNLNIVEQGRIAEALLKVVRERSHAVLAVLPPEDEVRRRKSISLAEVIKILPLSLEGYVRLKAGNSPAIKSLSRLQRLCSNSGMDNKMIEVVCDLKVQYQTWRSATGDSLTYETLGILRESGLRLLAQLTAGTSATRFSDLHTAAVLEANRLATLPRMPTTITANVLMGLVFALAVETA